MIQNAYSDPRFKYIGDLPTGYLLYDWKELYIRPFDTPELSLLSLGAGARYNGISHLLRAVDLVIDRPVRELTDGDFEFVIAWLRKYSFPATPLIVQWQCSNPIHVFPDNAIYEDGKPDRDTMRKLKLRPDTCTRKNTEIVHNVVMKIDAFEDDYVITDPELDLPRMATYSDYYEHIQKDPGYRQFGRVARHIKAGETYREKLAIIEQDADLYDRAYSLMQEAKHGVYEQMTLCCATCDVRVPHTAYPNYRSFFPETTDKQILDVQYTMMAKFHTAPNAHTSAMALLYHHSCLARDLKEEEERRRAQEAARRSWKR